EQQDDAQDDGDYAKGDKEAILCASIGWVIVCSQGAGQGGTDRYCHHPNRHHAGWEGFWRNLGSKCVTYWGKHEFTHGEEEQNPNDCDHRGGVCCTARKWQEEEERYTDNDIGNGELNRSGPLALTKFGAQGREYTRKDEDRKSGV